MLGGEGICGEALDRHSQERLIVDSWMWKVSSVDVWFWKRLGFWFSHRFVFSLMVYVLLACPFLVFTSEFLQLLIMVFRWWSLLSSESGIVIIPTSGDGRWTTWKSRSILFSIVTCDENAKLALMRSMPPSYRTFLTALRGNHILTFQEQFCYVQFAVACKSSKPTEKLP